MTRMLLPGQPAWHQSAPPSPRRFVGPVALGLLAVVVLGWVAFGRGPATAAGSPSGASLSPGAAGAAVSEGSVIPVSGAFYGLPPAPGASDALADGSVTADPAAGASSPPGAPVHNAAKFGFGAKGMKGEVLAFMTMPEVAYVRDKAALSAISTVAFFGLRASANGHILAGSTLRAWRGSAVRQVIA